MQCPLFLQKEEKTNHLLEDFPLSSILWDQGETIFHRSDKVRGQPYQTLKQWNMKAFKNLILGMIWVMFQGMLSWVLWKERNNRIFWDNLSIEDEVWKRIIHNIQDTVQNKQLEDRDEEFSELDAIIDDGWGISKNGLWSI